MNDYQPKVGDRVMVSEHGPYEVLSVNERDRTAVLLHVVDGRATTRAGTAMWSWLTPAPEPEPDLPTTPGALVRDGKDDLLVLDAERDWVYLTGEYPGSVDRPPDITRPISVVLADPAEVERLRTERDEAANELAHLSSLNNALTDAKNDLLRQRDELQRRIDFVLRVDLVRPDGWVAKVLRGES